MTYVKQGLAFNNHNNNNKFSNRGSKEKGCQRFNVELSPFFVNLIGSPLIVPSATTVNWISYQLPGIGDAVRQAIRHNDVLFRTLMCNEGERTIGAIVLGETISSNGCIGGVGS